MQRTIDSPVARAARWIGRSLSVVLGGFALPSPSAGLTVSKREIAVLFQRYGPMVYGRARRLLGSHEEAEETTQDIFVRVMANGDGLPQPNDVVLWLSRITTNHCLNKLRDARRRGNLLETRIKPAAGDEVGTRTPDLPVQVRALLALAEEREAQAAIYVFVDGMSHQETAEVLGVSKRTVGNLIERFTAWAREQSGEPAAKKVAAGGAR